MVILIPQCLLFSLRNPSYSLEETRVFCNLCALFQQVDVLLEVLLAREVTDVSQQLFWGKMG